MHNMQSLVLIALMAVCALAAPVSRSRGALSHKTFSMRAHPHRGGPRKPRDAMFHAFGKYGWQIIVWNPSENPWSSGGFGGEDGGDSTPSTTTTVVPAATSSAASSSTNGALDASNSNGSGTTGAAASATSAASSGDGETGDVAANPEANESEYLSKVTIGGQDLNLDFDTGSADLWVFSSSLSSSESAGHSVFDPSKSSTWSTYQNGKWQISYGDGSSASGSVGFDHVSIGGVTATKQAVELADTVSGSFVSDTNNDGLVGLAFSSINTVRPQQQSTFFESVMDQLEQPVFTANLKDNAAGLYTFGEIDSSQYSGDIHFTPIDKSNGFWQFDSPTYSIGGSQKQCSTCSAAIADTGTSLILLDDDVVKAYYSQVSGASISQTQGGYVYDCNTSLPPLGIAVGSDYTATIQGSDLTYANLGDGSCFGGLQSNQGQGIQILGDMFLKQFFAVFDGGNESFGVANKA